MESLELKVKQRLPRHSRAQQNFFEGLISAENMANHKPSAESR